MSIDVNLSFPAKIMKANNFNGKKIKLWKQSNVCAAAIHPSLDSSPKAPFLTAVFEEPAEIQKKAEKIAQPVILEDKILIVEASASDRATYRRYLAAHILEGDRFLEAATLKAGIELWRSHRPELVLINLQLPDGEGLDLLKIIAGGKTSPPLPAIVFTESGAESRAVTALKWGALDYFHKSEITAFGLRQTFVRWQERKLAAQALRNAYDELSEHHAELTVHHQQLQQSLREQTQAEQALKTQNLQLSRERQRYQNLFDFAPDGYLVTNTMGIIREVNQAILAQLAVERDYLIGQPFFSFFAQKNYTQFYDRLDQMMTRQQRQTWEVTLKPRQGQAFPAEVTVTLNYYDETTDEIRLLWFVRDITESERIKAERLQAETAFKQLNQELDSRVRLHTEALQQSEARLQEAQKVAHLGSWEWDVRTGEVLWSPEIFAILGLDPSQPPLTCEEMKGYIHPDDQDRRAELIQRAIRWAEPYEVDLQIIRADGSPGYIFSKGQPVCNEAGEVIRLFGIVMDICDRKQAEAKLQTRNSQLEQTLAQERKLNQLKDDFLSTVSHELRTPITRIKMATTLLEKKIALLDLSPDEKTAITRYLKILDTEVQREVFLIKDLLDMTKLEANSEVINLNTIVFEHFIPDIVAPFTQLAQQQGQRLTLDLPPAPNPFITDQGKLARMLTELLRNACKYSPQAATITLFVRATPTTLEIGVKNTGIEIAPEEHDRIFEKFYRIPNNDPWKQGGTGLGLALAQKLTEHMGGTLAVESGQSWTQFTAYLPWEIRPPFPKAEDSVGQRLRPESELGMAVQGG